jgi:hypothetical protein
VRSKGGESSKAHSKGGEGLKARLKGGKGLKVRLKGGRVRKHTTIDDRGLEGALKKEIRARRRTQKKVGLGNTLS